MDNIGVIDQFLATSVGYIDSGFGLLAGDVAYLTSTLIAIDIALAGIFWALADNTNILGQFLKKILYVGFFAFVIGNFSLLANIVFDSFAELGVTAGGGAMTAADLLRPGFIAGVGFDAANPLLSQISDMLGPFAFFHNFIMIVVMFVAWAIIMIAFFVLAVQLFITILEFKLTTLAGFVLVPFALWNKSAFLAERVLGNVVTSGIKLMVLAVIIGTGSTLFASVTDALRTAGDVTLAQVMGTVLAAIVFFWMGIFAPGVASGLITGAPQLGAGSAAGATAGVAAGTYVAGAGARASIGTASRGASSAVKAGASMAGAARTSFTLGSVASGSKGAKALAAGVAGMARAGTDTIRRAAGRPSHSLKDAYRRGSAQAWSATGGTGAAPSATAAQSNASSPDWARRMQARQNAAQAGQMAAHSLRDGDRGSPGAAPSLQDKDD